MEEIGDKYLWLLIHILCVFVLGNTMEAVQVYGNQFQPLSSRVSHFSFFAIMFIIDYINFYISLILFYGKWAWIHNIGIVCHFNEIKTNMILIAYINLFEKKLSLHKYWYACDKNIDIHEDTLKPFKCVVHVLNVLKLTESNSCI